MVLAAFGAATDPQTALTGKGTILDPLNLWGNAPRVQEKATPYEFDPNAFQSGELAALGQTAQAQANLARQRGVPGTNYGPYNRDLDRASMSLDQAQAALGVGSGYLDESSGLIGSGAGALGQSQGYLDQAASQLGLNNEARGLQLGALGYQERILRGQEPSVAALQLQRGNEDAIREQASIAAGARGGDIAAARRAQANNVASIQQRQALDAAMLRAQEQSTAAGQLAQGYANVRGGDVSAGQLGNTLAQSQLAKGQAYGQLGALQTSNANAAGNLSSGFVNAGTARGNLAGQTMGFQQQDLDRTLQGRRDADTTALAYGQQALDAANTQYQGGMTLEQLRGEQHRGAQDAAIGVETTNAQIGNQQKEGMLGTIGTGIGAIFSDRNVKTGIEDSGESPREALEALSGSRYRYKDPAHGEGEQFGLMAQDLESTEAGRTLVKRTAEGIRTVDPGRLAMLTAPEVGRLSRENRELSRRLEALEGAL